jgi:hypothetical protein
MNEDIIWFILKNDDNIINSSSFENLSILKIDLTNYKCFLNLISASINIFNSEIHWDKMWSIKDAEIRIVNNHHLYLLLFNGTPIGHVWYNGGFLYNAFVSKSRVSGSSVWFIKETLRDRFKYGFNTILLYTDTWNLKAINFWNKLGFIKQK